MRILFLSNLYPPNVVGGYERLCFEMAAGLAARGHEIAVLTSNYGGAVADYPGQRVERKWKLPVGRQAIYQPFEGGAEERRAIEAHNTACLDEEVRAFSPEVLFVWNLFFLDASLLPTIQGYRVPTVFLLTDNWMITFLNPAFWQAYFAEQVLDRPRSWLQWFRVRLSGSAATRGDGRFSLGGSAIFSSRFMERLYQQAGFRFSGSTVIYHGIAGGAAASPVSRAQFCASGELRLLVAGRVVEIKGVDTAIEALPRISARLPERRVVLTIVGDQGDAQYLHRLRGQIRRLKLDDHVRFQPPAPESELSSLFAAHDILLFPSLYEPFSLTLIHALRAGIPTVASDAGGNVEIVSDGANGKAFRRGDPRSLADNVLQLVRNDRLRATVSEGARRTAAAYTFSRMVEEVERYLGAQR